MTKARNLNVSRLKKENCRIIIITNTKWTLNVSVITYLAICHNNIDNSFLNKIHFWSYCSLLNYNITWKDIRMWRVKKCSLEAFFNFRVLTIETYSKCLNGQHENGQEYVPGWKTSYLSLVTTSDTKFESAFAKKGTEATNDLNERHEEIIYQCMYWFIRQMDEEGGIIGQLTYSCNWSHPLATFHSTRPE